MVGKVKGLTSLGTQADQGQWVRASPAVTPSCLPRTSHVQLDCKNAKNNHQLLGAYPVPGPG